MDVTLTADAVVFAAPNAHRLRSHDREWHVLTVTRKYAPFQGKLALPGGKLDPGETFEDCAVRELREETGLEVSDSPYAVPGIWDAVDRDPRGRYVSGAYAFVVDYTTDIAGADDAESAQWVPVRDALLPDAMAFDHDKIILAAWVEAHAHGLV